MSNYLVFISSLHWFSFSGIAQAIIIVVEPDDFSIGTDLTNAFPGVTLSVQGQPTTKVIAADGANAAGCCNPFPVTTGLLIFGQDPQPVPPLQKFNEALFGLMRADFALPTDYVQIDIIFDDDDIGILRAFDATDVLLDSVLVSGAGDQRGGLPPYVTAVISRGTSDIAYITVGGWDSEGGILDNLQFNRTSVPEPSTVIIFALALSGLYAFQRRRAR